MRIQNPIHKAEEDQNWVDFSVGVLLLPEHADRVGDVYDAINRALDSLPQLEHYTIFRGSDR